MKKIFSLFAAVLFAGSMSAAEVSLTNANIVAAGDGANGYQSWSIQDGANRTWNAYAIKNSHSKATASYHFLQIKKYASEIAYYVQIPDLGEQIQSITMTVSSTQKPMDGGSNGATLFFSASESTSAAGDGVASGTGDASVTIDASALGLTGGYITAGGAVRIWDIVVTTAGGSTPAVATPVISGDENFEESTTVTITCATEGAAIYYTLDGSEPNNQSAAYTAPFSLTETATVKAFAQKGTDSSAVATKTFTKKEPAQPITCLDVYQMAKNDVVGLLNPVTVTYSNGANVWVKDASSSMLIYLPSGFTNNFQPGDILSGVSGTVDIYQTLVYEVKPSAAQAAAISVSQGEVPAAVPVVSVDASDVNKLVSVYGASLEGEFTTASKTSITATIGEETVTIYNQFKFAYTFEAGKTYDILGVVSAYQGNPQVYFISAEEHTPAVTAISNTAVEAKAVKALKNGQLIIEKNGVRYNAQGAIVR